MKASASLDMTRGRIIPLVLRFALPLCLGNVLQTMYSTVDTLVIGNYGGTTSLAAIGTSSQPIELILCIFLGIAGGVSILVGQHMGAGEQEKLRSCARNAVSFVWICAIPLTALGILLGPAVLRMMQCPEDTMPAAVQYISIMFLGTLATLGYNTNAGILRGVGNSRSTLYFLLISTLLNIALDYLFIAGLGMDVFGAALATIIAQYTSWLSSWYYLRVHYPQLKVSLLPGRPDPAEMKAIIRLGLPLGLNNSLYSVGHILMQSLINLQGAAFIAAVSIANRIISMANIAIHSIASSATTFSAQNLGARKFGRLKEGGTRIPFVCGGVTMLGGLFFTLSCGLFLGFFTQDPEVLSLAKLHIRVVLPWTWAFAVFNALLSFVNGMGLVRYSTAVNLLMLWVIRIPAAILIAKYYNGLYVGAAISISFVCGMLAMLCYFLTPHWRNILQTARQENQTAPKNM